MNYRICRRILICYLVMACWTVSAVAALRLPAVIGDNMVLQRGQPAPIWGWANKGEEITVAVAGQTVTTKAGDDERWKVVLAKLDVGQPLEMTIKGSSGDAVTLKNILVGEVWVFSGQSNMAMTVNVCANAPKVYIKQRPALSEMINVMPVYYECLKWERGDRGSLRGLNGADGWLSGGWDAIWGGFGLLWAKDRAYAKKLIRCAISTARPDGKVAHCYEMDFSPHIRQQRYDFTDYLMLSLVVRYFDFFQDDAFLKEVAPFVRRLFGSIVATSDKQTGFVACEGLYPDFPWNVAGRQRLCYPAFEQTSLFAACCAVENFANKLDDARLMASANGMKERVRDNFRRYFFDEDKGYVYESVSLDGYKPNRCYPKYAIYGLGLPHGELLLDESQLRHGRVRLQEFLRGRRFARSRFGTGPRSSPRTASMQAYTRRFLIPRRTGACTSFSSVPATRKECSG